MLPRIFRMTSAPVGLMLGLPSNLGLVSILHEV
jgi:hypothetical protein